MNAYDYETQAWITGAEATATREKQVIEELSLLRGPDGAHYARFSGIDDRESVIARPEMELAGLQGRL